MLALVAVLVAAAQQPLPPDSAVRAILTARAAALHGAGIVVGLFGPDDERRVVAAGVPADRVFEIGSITHVFTAAALASMAASGVVRLDDPVGKHLPASVQTPSRNGAPITLLELASPSAEEDSSLDIGLLGDALALRAGKKFEDLLRQHVLWPLGMNETAIALVPDLRSRLALGHDSTGRVIPNRDFIAGAGVLRSTVKDMLTFLMVNVDSATTPTGRALHQHLSWRTIARPGGEGTIVWHNGGPGAYRSYIGFDPARGVGIVILTNSSVGVDDIGFHLLDQTFPLRPTSPSASPP
jgi:serine-type D-Ala-D-Ala carboxypeptidase/endopeptidase